MIRSRRFPPAGLALFGYGVVALALAAAAGAQEPLGPGPDRYYVYQLDHVSMATAKEALTVLGQRVVAAGATIGKHGAPDATPRPVVIQMPETAMTSIPSTAVGLGGNNPLSGPPAGAPLQRLLIVWDAKKPKSLATLLNLLHDQIDRPARQIRIEAMVLEVDRNRLKDLGVTFEGGKDGQKFDFGPGATTPFTYSFERPSTKTVLDLQIAVRALVENGSAEVLSQPSLLVLDGRQARIAVVDHTPYTQILSSDLEKSETVVSNTQWAQSGIALNLRPRATEDGSEVTMQVETLISAGKNAKALDNAVLGPPISNREVQTIVRVNNNTPFIIGGLISQLDDDQRSGIPYLSKIPGLGKLFRKSKNTRNRKEVIVVITPRVLPLEHRSFSFSVADDTDLLDQFGLELFANVYRIKSDDVYDLGFVRNSQAYEDLRQQSGLFARGFSCKATIGGWPPVPESDLPAVGRQMRLAMADRPPFMERILDETPELEELADPLIDLFSGGYPGEAVLVRRMLLGIVEKLDYGRHVQPERIHFFASDAGGGESPQLELQRLLPELKDLDKECGTVGLVFDRGSDGDSSFDPPVATARDAGRLADDDAYVTELRQGNRRGRRGAWERQAVLLNKCFERRGRKPLDLLRSVLALKRVLDVNPSLALTLDAFHIGRGVVFPDRESLKDANHIVDRRVAELFYETLDYYPAFESRFDQADRGITALAKKYAQAGDPSTWDCDPLQGAGAPAGGGPPTSALPAGDPPAGAPPAEAASTR